MNINSPMRRSSLIWDELLFSFNSIYYGRTMDNDCVICFGGFFFWCCVGHFFYLFFWITTNRAQIIVFGGPEKGL